MLMMIEEGLVTAGMMNSTVMYARTERERERYRKIEGRRRRVIKL